MLNRIYEDDNKNVCLNSLIVSQVKEGYLLLQ